ncbi:MAG: dihydrolipoyl dehydrogenase [Firmicutes bacterium]|nr:dihydrolipoyl dehydrogenase [Bacillota bacterium]
MEKFDLMVIGGGPGGYTAAIQAARQGMKAALAEEAFLGGTCLNRGCIPTKALLHAGEALQSMSRCGELGLHCDNASFDFAAVHRRKDSVVEELRQGIGALLQANGVTVYPCHARIAAPGLTAVADGEVAADKILIATGSAPAALPLPGADHPLIWNSDDVLSGEKPFPRRLIIVGGGVIGVEFATFFSDFGAQVTIVESLPRILANFDKSISQNLSAILKKQGVTIYTDAQVQGFSGNAEEICCRFTAKEQVQDCTADAVVLAVGRRAVVEDVLAADMRLELRQGRIVTDENYQTSLPGIYAIGDVRFGSSQLAHGAAAEAVNMVRLTAGKPAPHALEHIPSCVYCRPEIAAVGLTPEQAKAQGLATVSGKYLMSGNGKTRIAGGERGFVQVTAEAGSGRLLGAQLMCERATDMIFGLTAAIVNQLTVEQALAAVYPHPTFSEGIDEALGDILGCATHILPKRR